MQNLICPNTTIEYALPSRSIVTLRIYNTLGQLVETLRDGQEDAGYFEVVWNPSGLSSGVYFYRLQATSVDDPTMRTDQTHKLLYIR